MVFNKEYCAYRFGLSVSKTFCMNKILIQYVANDMNCIINDNSMWTSDFLQVKVFEIGTFMLGVLENLDKVG